MGREWFASGGGSGDGCGGSRDDAKSPSVTTANKSKKRREKNMKNNSSSSSSSSGCMSAIFSLFDIQHHQSSFRFNHPSFISESTININSQQSSNLVLQGVEAPRNSLETPETAKDNIAKSSSKVKDKVLNIQMGGIKIKTQGTRLSDDISSECSSSPSTKTPSLVARLMGLDILPEYSSPRTSSSSTPVNSHHRSSSLSRISTASRRSADHNIDYHHRLSLQVDDKENDMKSITQRRKSEEYAKQVANQVRERIHRRVFGNDISNTVSTTKNNNNKEQRRDSSLVLLKPKKAVARTPPAMLQVSVTTATKERNNENRTFSGLPKLRLLDINNNINNNLNKPKSLKEKKIKRIVSEKRYDLRLKKMSSQQDDARICKKKSTTLQHHVVDVKNTTKFLLVKKEMTSSSSTTRLPQKKVSFLVSMKHLPSNHNSSSYNNVVTTSHVDYISRIINQCGIYHTTLISYGKWHTLSHPLHPSIFHTLEKQYHHKNTAKRKLIFDFVDEFLSEILKPFYMNNLMCGNELIKKLCDKMASFGHGTKCDTLEDIDGLIERDIGMSSRRFLMTAVEAEMEEIVTEIVEMMVVEMVEPARTDKMRSYVIFT